jgi:hypothetical protein
VKARVLDSWAILEWINGGKPADTHVDALLTEGEGGNARLLMSAINVGEVYYFLLKDHRPALADSGRLLSGTLPVTIEVPTIEDIWGRRIAERAVSDFICRRLRGDALSEIQMPCGHRRFRIPVRRAIGTGVDRAGVAQSPKGAIRNPISRLPTSFGGSCRRMMVH